MDDPVANIINNYHELNAAVVDELTEEPSPLEFMRFVARNRPFIVRSAADPWPAVRRWDESYLRKAMSAKQVKVAVTPRGKSWIIRAVRSSTNASSNADAVVQDEDGSLLFVEPHEQDELFSDFLDYVQEDTKSATMSLPDRNVKYAQTQNDNLRNEYSDLFDDVLTDIPWARIALEKAADAVNMWIGNDRSVTSLHKDNYENVYVQIRGEKHFVLLSPIEMPCVNEQRLLQAKYVPQAKPSNDRVGAKLVVRRAEHQVLLPAALWDPDEPEKRTTPYTHMAKPLRVTLRPGDMLYLPAMWYHKVSQTSGAAGFAVAVNYWYDMDFSGSFWAVNSFMREVVEEARSRNDVEVTA